MHKIVGLLFLLIAVVSCDDVTSTSVAPSTTPVTEATTRLTEPTTTTPVVTTPEATTPVATTSTSPEPPTTPPPEPTPIYPTGDAKFPAPVAFTVLIAKTNKTCLDVKFAAQIVLSNGTKFLNLEKAVRAEPERTCPTENDIEIPLKLDFGGNTIEFVFKRDKNLTSAWLDTIHLTYHTDNETEAHQLNITEKLFESNGTIEHGKRYNCKGEVATKEKDEAKVVFKEVDVRVGSDEHGTDLTTCPGDDTDVNDMIPIAVGAALLALVAIVLVAYFVGRRRSRRLAYQSV